MSVRLTDEQLRAEAARGGNFHSTSMAVELLAIRAENEQLRIGRDEALGLLNANEDIAKTACAERDYAVAMLLEAMDAIPYRQGRDDA